MRPEYVKFAEAIEIIVKNEGVKMGTKKAKEIEAFMLYGYMLAERQIKDDPSAYLSLLVGSGRQLTEEVKRIKE